MMIKHPDYCGPVGLGSELDCGFRLDLIAHLPLTGRLWSDKNWGFESNTLEKKCV